MMIIASLRPNSSARETRSGMEEANLDLDSFM